MPPMGGIVRWFGGPRDLGLALLVSLGMGVFFALIAPFGGGTRTFAERLVYCIALALAGGLPYFLMTRALLTLGTRLRLPIWQATPLSVVLIALPLAAISTVVRAVVWPDAAPVSLVRLYFQVVCLIAPITIASVAFFRQRRLTAAARDAADEAVRAGEPPALLKRLAPGLGTEIHALEAEDHYVRVHTAKGSTLVLMRFADALEELGALPGVRVHRSWWVARVAVAGTVKEGRKASLKLAGGQVVPVARNAMPEARAAGMLAGYAAA